MVALTGPRLAMVAGETSGDLLGGLLLGGLRARWPTLQAHGIGGPRMAAQGFRAQWPHHKLAVRGYVEVLRHYREIIGIRRDLRRSLLVDKPDAFIGIDAPDFNLDLEADLKAAGVPTVHFVCPSIWAWRGRRVERLARSADHVLCLFPFEPELLRPHGVTATYVGHPLADVIPLVVPRVSARAALGLGEAETVVALLPGSRRSEVAYIAPCLLRAAALLAQARPGLRFVLPVVAGLHDAIRALQRVHASGLELTLLEGRSHEALAACDLTLIASGTATLEAALFKRPMVIAYRMHAVTWALMKRMKYQPWVGLPNILCQDFVVPELLQEQATPQALAKAALDWLDNPQRVDQVVERFTELHLLLRRDTARLATDAIAQTCGF